MIALTAAGLTAGASGAATFWVTGRAGAPLDARLLLAVAAAGLIVFVLLFGTLTMERS